MSNSKTPTAAQRNRAAAKASKKAVVQAAGDPIPLIIPIPGGLARFRRPKDLTPRHTRDLEAIGGELLPRLGQIANAQRVSGPDGGQVIDESGLLTGVPVGLSRAEVRMFMEMQEAAAFAYLESWTIDRELPIDADGFADLPRPLYNPIIEHASKLLFHNPEHGFSVDALPADGEPEDPDLPTSPSAASPAR